MANYRAIFHGGTLDGQQRPVDMITRWVVTPEGERYGVFQMEGNTATDETVLHYRRDDHLARLATQAGQTDQEDFDARR